MNSFKSILILLLLPIFISCNEKSQVKEGHPISKAIDTNSSKENNLKTDTMEKLISTFKKAVIAKDVATLEAMTDMKTVGKDFFNASFFSTWEDSVLSLTMDDVEESLDVTGAYNFTTEISDIDENGEEVGSGLLFTIKNVNGNFKIISIMGIG